MSKRRQKKISQDPFLATIEGLSHDGRGIAHINNKITFIHNALPGEQVEAKLIQTHGTFNEAQAETILTASDDRVTPPCAHFNLCGGCSMQHMNPDAQIVHKEKTLLEQFAHFGKIKPKTVLPPLTSETVGYRRKARLGVRYVIKKEKLLIGFRERNGRYITEIKSCIVLHPAVGQKISALQDLIVSLSQFQQIPQIEVAVGEKRTALVIRHLQPLTDEDIQKISLFADANQFEIYLQPKGPETVHKIWPKDGVNRLIYLVPNYGVTMQFHPCDFTQINQEINRKMIDRSIELLAIQPTDKILDLFCGLGNFTVPIAKQAQHVIGVEGNLNALDRARENAKINHIKNITFELANLSETIDHLSWAKQQYDKILIDPPRSGAQEMIKSFPPMRAKRIVYISCNPATLARDAGILVNEHGYTLEKVGVMDMFPHTTHVESIALFTRD